MQGAIRTIERTFRTLMATAREFVLTLSCRDAKGVVYAVSGLLYQAGCNIVDSQQFGDVLAEDGTGLFFMRVHFEAPEHLSTPGTLDQLFTHVREPCLPKISTLASTNSLFCSICRRGSEPV